MFRLLVLAGLAALALSLSPNAARAQVLGRIRQQTTDKLKEKKKQADDRLVNATGEVVDSVAEKSARGIDTVVSKGSNVVTTAVDRTEQAVSGAFRSGDGESVLAKQLAAGHVVLVDLQFTPDGTLAPASSGTIRSLARLMQESQDPWIVEGHVASGANDQAMSDQRARIIKGSLVEEGMDPSRVWARGFGSTRAAAGSGAPSDRIEIVRMQ